MTARRSWFRSAGSSQPGALSTSSATESGVALDVLSAEPTDFARLLNAEVAIMKVVPWIDKIRALCPLLTWIVSDLTAYQRS